MQLNNAEFSSASLMDFIWERCFSMDSLLLQATALRKEVSSWAMQFWLKEDTLLIQIQN